MSLNSTTLNEPNEYNQFHLYGDVIRQALRYYRGILLCFKRQDMDSAVWIVRDEHTEHCQDGINESEHPEVAQANNDNHHHESHGKDGNGKATFQVGIDSRIVIHPAYGTGFSVLETTIEDMVKTQEAQLKEMFQGLHRILFFHARDEQNPHAYLGMQSFVKMMLDLNLWGQASVDNANDENKDEAQKDYFHFKLINSHKSQEIQLDYCNHLDESKTFKQFHQEWTAIARHMINMMELQNEPEEKIRHQQMLNGYEKRLNVVSPDYLRKLG